MTRAFALPRLRSALVHLQTTRRKQTLARTQHPRHVHAQDTRKHTMPGRTTARSTRSARSSTATTATTATATTTTTRKSTRGRSSAANVEIPDEGPDTSLRKEINQIFNDAQSTTATQRKLQTMLRKIQERCCYEQDDSKKKKKVQDEEEQFDQQDFNDAIVRCLLRVLNVKKGVQEGDRVIKFLGLFVKNALEKGKSSACGTLRSPADSPQTAKYTKGTPKKRQNCPKLPPAVSSKR